MPRKVTQVPSQRDLAGITLRERLRVPQRSKSLENAMQMVFEMTMIDILLVDLFGVGEQRTRIHHSDSSSKQFYASYL